MLIGKRQLWDKLTPTYFETLHRVTMKATITILSAEEKFTPKDLDTFRRVASVLQAHNLSVVVKVNTRGKKVRNQPFQVKKAS